jgi:hypothetical protein
MKQADLNLTPGARLCRRPVAATPARPGFIRLLTAIHHKLGLSSWDSLLSSLRLGVSVANPGFPQKCFLEKRSQTMPVFIGFLEKTKPNRTQNEAKLSPNEPTETQKMTQTNPNEPKLETLNAICPFHL